MSTFGIIEGITLSPDGPLVGNELVHLRQGDMDGACGPYSLMMCLLILGVVDRAEALAPDGIDGRTSIGKLWTHFGNHKAFFSAGTTLDDLERLFSNFKRHVAIEQFQASGVETRKFVYKHLLENHPVILGVQGKEFAHWVVVVGWEDVEGDGTPERFLLLDPGYDAPRTSVWNSVIDLAGGYGRYPYHYWSWQGGDNVALDGALAVY